MTKYHAMPTIVDGIRFASMKESRRYGELKLLERAREIHDLRVQPRFVLEAGVPPTKVGEYRGDFQYCVCATPSECRENFIVEDVKGFRTAMYRWKAKHLRAQYGIEIREV